MHQLAIVLPFLLLVIFYQDLKFRAVSWIILPLLLLIMILSEWKLYAFKTYLFFSVINIVIVTFHLLLILTYFKLKEGNKNVRLTGKLGLGDIIFMYVTCFYFSPFNFMVFFITTLVFTLIVVSTLLFFFNNKKIKQSIPLAGLQAICLLVFITAKFFTRVNPFDDGWLLNYLPTV